MKVPTIKRRLSDLILPNFIDFWKAAKSDKYTYYVLKGGRNSAKSSHIALFIIYWLMKNSTNALVVRKIGNTLQESVYEQLKWAIGLLGVNEYWKIKKNPLEMIYIPNKSRILFRGADNPLKLKSLKTSKNDITILWIEELAEFTIEEDIEVILNSVLRAESEVPYKIFYSYNPPRQKTNWVNKRFGTADIPERTYIHHSTYLGNKFVSKEFVEEAERVKVKDENKYRHIYLGEPIGTGIIPFSNISFRKITDEEIKRFDNIKQGLDFGYANDPLAFVRVHYDKTRRKIYVIDEIYRLQTSNRELARAIIEKKYNDTLIIADSAEPKSIDELKGYGLKIRGAKKGPGSVEYGIKWLNDLEEIVIDSQRTPNTAKEFELIDYKMDKIGNIKNDLVGADHAIDAVRYALEDEMKTRKATIGIKPFGF